MSQSSGHRAQLIITADDFGRDETCTVTIADCLSSGRITATSIMANASHFEQACDLVRSKQLEGRVGVHLSLDEGPPLSPEMRPFANAMGHLCVPRGLRLLGGDLSRAVEAELAAQIERVLSAGIKPTHLDSHRHIHTSFPIGRIVVRMARRYGIAYVRPARNLARRNDLPAMAYKWLFNRYVASQVRTADYFGDIVDFYDRRNEVKAHGLIECMAHLDESPRGRENLEVLCTAAFVEYLANFQLIGHAQTGH